MAVALEGFRFFEPMLPFDADTASGLMAALLLWDLASPQSHARLPTAGGAALPRGNAAELLATAAVHGGCWRCAWTADSVGKSAYVLGLLSGAR